MTSRFKKIQGSPFFILVVILSVIYRLEGKDVEGNDYVMFLLGGTLVHYLIAAVAVAVFCAIFDRFKG
jgi:hypothetical protein